MTSITDKELLAICNLSNLKMEFANLIEKFEEKEDPNVKGNKIKIYTNHTIYSLIKNELEVLKLQEKYINIIGRQIPDGNLENLKEIYSKLGESMNSNSKELFVEQNNLRKEERIYRKELDKIEKNRSFSNISKENKQLPIYSDKKELQKEAPIIMEYYDRYQSGNEEGKFLDEWEVVYGGDFYEILLDYFILTKSNFVKKDGNVNEGMSIISSPTTKYDFKINEGFIFREDIISKKNFSYKLNFTFDLLSAVLPARELREFIFVNTNHTRTSLLKELFVLSKPLAKTVETKTIFENADNSNIIEKFLELCSHRNNKDKVLGALDINISMDIIDTKIVIVRKKSSNDFIVAFKSSASNKIIQDLNKGVLNLDLITFNNLIEHIIKNSIKNNSQVNVCFTGYGEGATLATACYLMNNSISGIKEEQNSNERIRINYQNRSFIGTTPPPFLELIYFNVYDIEYITPGSFSYSANFQEDIKNFFDSLITNMKSTGNIGLIASILLKRSLFAGVYSAFAAIGSNVFITLIIIYFVYSYFNRLRIKNIETRFRKKEIILKLTDKHNKINEKLFDYVSIIDSYSKIHIIDENKFDYSDSFYSESEIHNYIDNFFEKIKDDKNEINLIPFKLSEDKIIYIPFVVAIKLIFSNIFLFENMTLMHNQGYIHTKLYYKNTVIFGKNYNELYFLKLNEKNEFIGIIKRVYEELSYPISSKYWHIKTPTFSFEKMIVLSLNTIFTAQKKYNEKYDKVFNSEFIYLKGNLNEDDKVFIKKTE